jgi:L-cysteine:1D-myo-inositol 2-amino-2-deoxy-alpha-D-glucopyranoside ligase
MQSWPSPQLPDIQKAKTPLSIFSTDKQMLVTLPEKKNYQIYVCGITPYDATHLGHAATYLSFDILIRYLRSLGAEVNYIQNITDIDDPLLERANRDNVDWKELAHSQIELFRSDMGALRIVPPNHYEGAVAAIPEVIQAIKTLNANDAVYIVEDDLYFEIGKDVNFGFESHLSREEMLTIFAERGGDPNRSGKKDPLDALLWLSQRPNEPTWNSPFGNGRPGWHIECAAIALKFAEPSEDEYVLDIQGGGSDLIFPHHEMSASQTKLLTGKNLARAFVHTGLIGLDGEKMSKSKGNLLFVSKLISEGNSPMAIRWALLKRHYRSDYMWMKTEIYQAQEEIHQLERKLSATQIPPTAELVDAIYRNLANDLNTAEAIQAINEWVSTEGTGGNKKELVKTLDGLLGILLTF